mmetsp:Transcript_5338/g.9774  ORF Transcript_5338/g.9774 Transcript_5338/m.9774 type:complete len:96 (-) Transcript_5338:318-605(-)|eukprot:CAMPEP_0183719412 /NCGR_PEP_ID=MMETSP0737-20130205/12363_1 /TAXON_ID=385413 /ORGANISM="Thalassiosira miniscula, Strain CCMP1093" /LENGTH=95 /DNA_ID=CAMNT_0025949129 /DNA_START=300 /DNA_END=587 /DNA_ORIENTATION=-
MVRIFRSKKDDEDQIDGNERKTLSWMRRFKKKEDDEAEDEGFLHTLRVGTRDVFDFSAFMDDVKDERLYYKEKKRLRKEYAKDKADLKKGYGLDE